MAELTLTSAMFNRLVVHVQTGFTNVQSKVTYDYTPIHLSLFLLRIVESFLSVYMFLID